MLSAPSHWPSRTPAQHPGCHDLWLVYLGATALRDAWLKRRHQHDRSDLSLFRVGLRLLARCLKDDILLREGFLVLPVLPRKPVRQPLKRTA